MEGRTIKLLVMDVDGTLTDGKIYLSELGECIKAFDVKDGLGIRDILPSLHIIPVIMTGRVSEILSRRCRELGIEYLYQGILDKKEMLNQLLEKLQIHLEETAFIGDDINDLECMKIVGIAACPKDAVKQIIEIADFVTESIGGHGAVREFIDWLSNEGFYYC
ncbi:HAD-IIIA family hydrolase [Enterocloster aldenensis]|uniref:KdsC family phosphatase n=1 Tax=Enterocloster aldenensis TaxID=358742 RepID=UPI000E51A5C2|nr:HAD-IIIA family hydrolase [Enterocloster aldenensis]